MRAIGVLAISVALSASSLARAEAPAAVPSEIQEMADQFFAAVKDGHAADAFRSALVGLGAVVDEKSLKSAADNAEDRLRKLGPVVDWTPIRTKAIAPTFIEETYMLRCWLAPMFFRIDFYNSGARWKIVNISMNVSEEKAEANL